MNFSGILKLNGLNAGASEAKIAAAEREMSITLPVYYKAMLSYADGALLDSGLLIYSTGELAERNETYEVADYCDGYILIGDDSGGKGFLIKIEDDNSAVFSSGLGDLDPSDFYLIASSFQEWVDKGFII